MKHSRKVTVGYTLLGLLVALSLFTAVEGQEGQVTLNPIHDTYTSTEAPESNYGDAPYLKVTITEAYTRFIWLKFNLSAVPDGAIITSANLELYAMGVVHIFEPETYNVSTHSCSDNSWSEESMTRLNQPDYESRSTSWVLVETPEQWYSWDATKLVQRHVDVRGHGENETTIVLQENLNHRPAFNVIFSSKENENEQHFPKLTVQWSGIEPDLPEHPWASVLLVTFLLLLITPAIVITVYKRTHKH